MPKNGVIINVTQEKVIRFLPPLNITKSDVNYVIDVLDKIFKKYS